MDTLDLSRGMVPFQAADNVKTLVYTLSAWCDLPSHKYIIQSFTICIANDDRGLLYK